MGFKGFNQPNVQMSKTTQKPWQCAWLSNEIPKMYIVVTPVLPFLCPFKCFSFVIFPLGLDWA